jgi:hypothetical protein
VQIPPSVRGKHKFIAVGETSGKKVSVSYTVTSSVVIKPAKGKTGTVVELTVLGFKAGERFSIRWYNLNGTSYKTLKSNIKTNSVGTGTAKFTVPAGEAKGKHGVGAVGNKDSMAFQQFNVTSTSATKMALPVQKSLLNALATGRSGTNVPHDAVLTTTSTRRQRVRRLSIIG